MILMILLYSCANFVFAQDLQHKIIFDFTKNDTANFTTIVRHAKNIMIVAGSSKLEIVCHGPGLDLLLKDKTTVEKEIDELHKKYNVVFVACEATMQRRNIDRSQLLSLAGTVPLANLEISSKQQKGWSYIKAGQ